MEVTIQDTTLILHAGQAIAAPIGTLTLRVCMFCGDHLGEKDWCGGTLTHGSCEPCMDKELEEICQSCLRRETGYGGTE